MLGLELHNANVCFVPYKSSHTYKHASRVVCSRDVTGLGLAKRRRARREGARAECTA